MLGTPKRRERPGAAAWDPWQGGPVRWEPGIIHLGGWNAGGHPVVRSGPNFEIQWGSATLRGSTRDVSSNGMSIESADPLWVGAGFSARLALDQPAIVDCFVKRVEPGRGMGVVVTVSEERHQQRYQDLLSSLSTLTP
jgi:hypothetical protein